MWNGQVKPQLEDGLLTVLLYWDRHRTNPAANLPPCTRSQILEYVDRDGTLVAKAHQFLLPDGKVGASGEPDPKAILHDGTLYFC